MADALVRVLVVRCLSLRLSICCSLPLLWSDGVLTGKGEANNRCGRRTERFGSSGKIDWRDRGAGGTNVDQCDDARHRAHQLLARQGLAIFAFMSH